MDKRDVHYFPVCSFCKLPHDRLEPCPVADKVIEELVHPSCPSCAALRADKRRLSDTVAAQVAEMAELRAEVVRLSRGIATVTTVDIAWSAKDHWEKRAHELERALKQDRKDFTEELRLICGELGEFYGKGQNTAVEKIRFLRKDYESQLAVLREEVRTLEICIHKQPRPVEFYEDDGTARRLEWEEGDESVGIFSCYRAADSIFNDLQILLTALRARVAELEEERNEGDTWMERARTAHQNGMCPSCFCTDEGPHEKGCEWYEMEYRIRILEKSSELNANIAVSAIDRAADKESIIFAAESRAEKAEQALKELHALVWGECSSLLNEDSGGSGRLDAKIRDIIDGPVKAGRK